MNNDKIIEALNTEVYCENCPHNGSDCLTEGCYYISAATLIERLEKQLAAAIKDMLAKDHCDVCKHSREGVAECDASDFECGDCKSDNCVCRHCQDEDKWEWRGAEKGAERG